MEENIEIRQMCIDDYEEVIALWKSIKGFRIRRLDDDAGHIEKFLKRNEGLSVVAARNGRIVGTVLAGHDGRQASLYHVCVAKECRGLNIAGRMVDRVTEALKSEGISKITLIAFKKNLAGNLFWKNKGWRLSSDINSYELILNGENTSRTIR